MAVVWTVTNEKGGVGKTTSSTNIAGELARMGKETLLIDLDPQCDSTKALDLVASNDPRRGKASSPRPLGDLFAYRSQQGQAATLGDVVVQSYVPKLLVAPGDKKIRLNEALDSDPDCLSVAISPYLDELDYVIIDTPGDLGPLTRNAITAALKSDGWVLVPLQPEMFAVDNFADLLDTLDLRCKAAGITDTDSAYRLLMVMLDSREKRNVSFAGEELKPFKSQLFEAVVRRCSALSQAQSYKQLVRDYDPRSNATLDYLEVAKAIIELGHRSSQQEREPVIAPGPRRLDIHNRSAADAANM